MNADVRSAFFFLAAAIAVLVTGLIVTPHPPRHIEWEVRDVGGYILCHPNPDSTDVRPCVRLPEGAQVWVPHWVAGPQPRLHQKES